MTNTLTFYLSMLQFGKQSINRETWRESEFAWTGQKYDKNDYFQPAMPAEGTPNKKQVQLLYGV